MAIYKHNPKGKFRHVRVQHFKQGILVKTFGFSSIDCESLVPMGVNNNMSHFLPCPLMHEISIDHQLLDQENQLKMLIQLF